MENIFQPPPMLHALVYVHYVYSLGCTIDETPLFFKKLTGLINFACEFTQDYQIFPDFLKPSFKITDTQTKHVSFEQIFIDIQSENLDKLSKERLQYYCNALKLKVSGDKKELTQRLEPLAKCEKKKKKKVTGITDNLISPPSAI